MALGQLIIENVELKIVNENCGTVLILLNKWRL